MKGAADRGNAWLGMRVVLAVCCRGLCSGVIAGWQSVIASIVS